MRKIIVGLPESISDQVLWVAREFRTNPLSHEPGGSDVIVEYYNAKIYGYDWIKFPSFYISKIWNVGISKIYINYEQFDKGQQLKIIKQNIKRIFARKYKQENFNSEPFKEIWNSATSDKLPWQLLEEFNYYHNFDLEAALSEYLERQAESPEYQNYQINKAIEEKAFDEYLKRQVESPEYQNYLINKAIEEKRLDDYLNGRTK